MALCQSCCQPQPRPRARLCYEPLGQSQNLGRAEQSRETIITCRCCCIGRSKSNSKNSERTIACRHGLKAFLTGNDSLEGGLRPTPKIDDFRIQNATYLSTHLQTVLRGSRTCLIANLLGELKKKHVPVYCVCGCAFCVC